MPEPTASVIIPVYNRPDELAAVLAHLDRQDARDFEVVVVDDGSRPAVADQLHALHFSFPLSVVRHAEPGGIARARNAGVKAAHGKIIIFLDSDCELNSGDWVQRHIDVHSQLPAVDGLDPGKPAVVHGKVNGLHTTYAGYADGYSNWFFSSGNKPYLARTHHLPANNTSVRKCVFDLVGFFDEECGALEDVEWSFRCLAEGVQLLYLPDMPVGHTDRRTFRELWRHYYTMGRYSLVVRSKQQGSPYACLFPHSVMSGWIQAIPLISLMTAYITLQWLTRDRGVLLYVPGLLLANIAYYAGIMAYLYDMRESRR